METLLETYIKTLLESDKELQVEFSCLGGGAVQGVIAEPTVIPFKTKLKKIKTKNKNLK